MIKFRKIIVFEFLYKETWLTITELYALPECKISSETLCGRLFRVRNGTYNKDWDALFKVQSVGRKKGVQSKKTTDIGMEEFNSLINKCWVV